MISLRLPVIAALAAICASALPARADLASYVARAEPDYSWKQVETTESGDCTIHKLRLVSQVWQGIKWEHDLVIYEPKDVPAGTPMLLLNTGGSARPSQNVMGMTLATRVKAPCAVLFQIPNQPLFEGKKEDALIAETFCRYLDTGDENWPLLFPMVKSCVKAMDALQAWSLDKKGRPQEKFILTGASKRGWTTWLTAAVDKRLMAIAPMVIDVLNTQEQMKHQFYCYGAPSEAIQDYTNRGLIPPPQTEVAQKLWKMTDPWFYRAQFTLPKLVVLGTNDQFWTVDALNLYWDGLPGPKWISYSPNANHGLSDGKSLPFRAINNTCAFVRHQITGKPAPVLTWKHSDADGKALLTITADQKPLKAHVWKASSKGRDFRKAEWNPSIVELKDNAASVQMEMPTDEFTAFFCDYDYEIDGISYSLCTQLRVLGKGEPARTLTPAAEETPAR